MSQKLGPMNFFEYEEGHWHLSSAGLLLVDLLIKRGIFSTDKMLPTVRTYYEKTISENFEGSIVKEHIKHYFGTRYVDDFTIYEDIKNKGSLNRFWKILNNNDKIKELGLDVHSTLIHLFNEIDRNIRNHSGFIDTEEKNYLFQVQIYPNNKKLQVSFLDEGVGFKETMKHICKENEDPVLKATEYGVTAKSNHELASDSGKNSGYGLYLINELSKKTHSFEIISDCEYYCSAWEKGLIHHKRLTDKYKKITLVSFIIDLTTIIQDVVLVQENTVNKSEKSNVTILDVKQLKQHGLWLE
ncbi:MAG: hypothetical protein ACRCUP_01245 [Mycoplasmatales bacterium]